MSGMKRKWMPCSTETAKQVWLVPESTFAWSYSMNHTVRSKAGVLKAALFSPSSPKLIVPAYCLHRKHSAVRCICPSPPKLLLFASQALLRVLLLPLTCSPVMSRGVVNTCTRTASRQYRSASHRPWFLPTFFTLRPCQSLSTAFCQCCSQQTRESARSHLPMPPPVTSHLQSTTP